MKMCRHCGVKKANRPRGLCWAFYYASGVRELYPSASNFVRRILEDFIGRAKLSEPTTELPGTEEKLVVMQRRASAREAIFHPKDSTREV